MSKTDDSLNNLKQEVDKIKKIAVKFEEKFLTEEESEERTPEQIFKENPDFAALLYYHPNAHEKFYGEIQNNLPKGAYGFKEIDFLIWEEEEIQPNKKDQNSWVDPHHIKTTAKEFWPLKFEVKKNRDENRDLQLKYNDMVDQLDNATRDLDNEKTKHASELQTLEQQLKQTQENVNEEKVKLSQKYLPSISDNIHPQYHHKFYSIALLIDTYQSYKGNASKNIESLLKHASVLLLQIFGDIYDERKIVELTQGDRVKKLNKVIHNINTHFQDDYMILELPYQDSSFDFLRDNEAYPERYLKKTTLQLRWADTILYSLPITNEEGDLVQSKAINDSK